MTLARGAALGALAVVVVVRRDPRCSGGGGTHKYRLDFQNAGQLVKGDDVQVGGRRDRPGRHDRADARQPGARSRSRSTGRLRAAARGHDGDDPRDLALGHRQPLHRARPRARTTRRSSTTAPPRHRQDDLDRRPRPALQHARPEDAARACRASSRARPRSSAGHDQQLANLAAQYFNPALSTTARLVNELDRDTGDLHAAASSRARARSPRVADAARRPDEPRHQREHDRRRRSARRAPSLSRALAAAARHACAGPTRRSSTCARRSTTSTRSSTRPSRRPSASRRFFARAAPARRTRAPDDRRPAPRDLAARRRTTT